MNFEEYLQYLNPNLTPLDIRLEGRSIPWQYQKVIDMTGAGCDHSKGRHYLIMIPFPSHIAQRHMEGFKEHEKPQPHDLKDMLRR